MRVRGAASDLPFLRALSVLLPALRPRRRRRRAHTCSETSRPRVTPASTSAAVRSHVFVLHRTSLISRPRPDLVSSPPSPPSLYHPRSPTSRSTAPRLPPAASATSALSGLGAPRLARRTHAPGPQIAPSQREETARCKRVSRHVFRWPHWLRGGDASGWTWALRGLEAAPASASDALRRPDRSSAITARRVDGARDDRSWIGACGRTEHRRRCSPSRRAGRVRGAHRRRRPFGGCSPPIPSDRRLLGRRARPYTRSWEGDGGRAPRWDESKTAPRGSPGGTVTIAHTGRRLRAGIVTLGLSAFIVPEQLHPWLTLAWACSCSSSGHPRDGSVSIRMSITSHDHDRASRPPSPRARP